MPAAPGFSVLWVPEKSSRSIDLLAIVTRPGDDIYLDRSPSCWRIKSPTPGAQAVLSQIEGIQSEHAVPDG